MICRLSPGRITADNVLVDSKLKTWLTDFARANQVPQWWDFICLEATIRFDLSRAPDLLAWQNFESCLMQPARLDEGLEEKDVDTPELRVSVTLIEQIRHQAALETGPDIVPYYAGLLAWIIRALIDYRSGKFWTVDRLRGVHLLLAACMLAKKLDMPIDTYRSEGPLRLDENGKVWLGERKVAALTGLRLKLLQYLILQQGEVTSNLTITENVYGEQYHTGNEDQNQRIRQEISRLRDDIEPNPGRPRYILTERGRGYRLSVSGEPEN
jgi:DNA-binding winged helix-turn-helix (wHTH) protein